MLHSIHENSHRNSSGPNNVPFPGDPVGRVRLVHIVKRPVITSLIVWTVIAAPAAFAAQPTAPTPSPPMTAQQATGQGIAVGNSVYGGCKARPVPGDYAVRVVMTRNNVWRLYGFTESWNRSAAGWYATAFCYGGVK